MKVVVLYRPNSEHGRTVEEFVHEFQRRYAGERIEVLNVDTRDGMAMASLYDIMRYPAIMVLRDDGYMSQLWEGDALPLIDEIFGYAHA